MVSNDAPDGVVLERTQLAHTFAAELAATIRSPTFLAALKEGEPMGEHAAVAPMLSVFLKSFLVRNKCTEAGLLDWEGNATRSWAQAHSYPVLGTWAHPDAAVLRPFRCAIEFDRGSKSVSHFKAAMLKAAVHALSGAYDSALFVYLVAPGRDPDGYVSDGSAHTAALLSSLKASGLHVAAFTV